MPSKKKLLLMVVKGGVSQSEIAAALHVSKREVSKAAKAIRESGVVCAEILDMDEDVIEERFFGKGQTCTDSAYLKPDLASLIERKKHNRRLPVKMLWMEYCEDASVQNKLSYSYQTFCEMFAKQAELTGATRHFEHEPAAKAFIDWAGDVAYITDKLTGAKTKVYIFVITLPFSGKFWAEGFIDMRQRSWQLGHIHAFEEFGGVPRMLVPDNAATATDRTATRATRLNKDYERMARHYGTAILPARVRRPKDKSLAEGTVNIVEQWVIAPALERTFYTLDEFNEFCHERCSWLNDRPFSHKEGSRNSIFIAEERDLLLPLPPERYEMCEWRQAKVSPDYHVTVEYMHYSVPHAFIGRQVDIRLSATSLDIMADGEKIASHKRLYGRKGQYSTIVEHMPANHREQSNPWSPARFESWARRIGSETERAIKGVMESRPIVEQSFVACRNILGLSKTYAPELLEAACEKVNAASAVASYTACKNAILAIKAQRKRSELSNLPQSVSSQLVDNAECAGRLRGADAYRRKGSEQC